MSKSVGDTQSRTGSTRCEPLIFSPSSTRVGSLRKPTCSMISYGVGIGTSVSGKCIKLPRQTMKNMFYNKTLANAVDGG